jgi:four helix bundle protein
VANDQTKVSSYRDLLVWQKGIGLVKLLYEISREFPADERFGLTSQNRRAAVSVPANIAEGQALSWSSRSSSIFARRQ